MHYSMSDDDDLFPDWERIDKLNSPMPSDEHSFPDGNGNFPLHRALGTWAAFSLLFGAEDEPDR
jgi:hypothetical protein